MDWDKLTAAVKAQSAAIIDLRASLEKLKNNHLAVQDACIEEMKKELENLDKISIRPPRWEIIGGGGGSRGGGGYGPTIN